MTSVCTHSGLRLDATLLVVIATLALACNRSEPSPDMIEIPISTRSTTALLSEQDWAGWRGGSHRGVSAATELPVEWDQRHGVAWSVPIEAGRSSPIVCGEHVMFTSEMATESGTDCSLHCLNRLTGESLWTDRLGTASGPTHRKNGYAAATPVCDGIHIYTSLPPLGIFCHDLEGNLRWQASLGELTQQWGFASSPVLYEGLVIQLADGEQDSFLTAFATHSGKIVWRVPRQSVGCWSTPVIASFGDRDLLIVNGTGKSDGSQGDVTAYDPLTGETIWNVTGTTDIPCPTPLVTNDLVISSSGGNGPILALHASAESAGDQRIAWKHAAGGAYVPSGVIHDDFMFLIADGGVLTCHRVATGEQLYRKRLIGTFSASLVLGDGKLYVTSEQGDCYVIEAGEDFALLSTNRMRQRCLATPAIAHGQIFLRTESTLYCIGGSHEADAPNPEPAPGKVLPSPSDTLQHDPLDDAVEFITSTDDETA